MTSWPGADGGTTPSAGGKRKGAPSAKSRAAATPTAREPGTKVCSRAKTAVRDKLRKLKEKLSAEPAHGAGSQPSPGCHTQ